MRTDTRVMFAAYVAGIALAAGIDSNDANIAKFAADPAVQQSLEDRMQESSAFLSLINNVPVPEMKGEKVGLGVSGLIASRTDTSGAGERSTKDPSGLDNRGYECFQTDFDTHLGYNKLDMWAKFPDFEERIRNHILRAQMLDIIKIGWNGVAAAATTDPVANPLGQDVNIGWLEKLRLERAVQFMDEGATAGQVRIGAGGDYANIDALIEDARQQLLPNWARDDSELVAICGHKLVHDKYFPIVNADHTPENQLARDVMLSDKQLGGLTPARVPYFPDSKLMITRLDNLSRYYQEGKRRRHIQENPAKNRVDNFESSNDSFVIEDLDFAAAVENIVFV